MEIDQENAVLEIGGKKISGYCDSDYLKSGNPICSRENQINQINIALNGSKITIGVQTFGPSHFSIDINLLDDAFIEALEKAGWTAPNKGATK